MPGYHKAPEIFSLVNLMEMFGVEVLNLPNDLLQDIIEVVLAKQKASSYLDSLQSVLDKK